MYGIGNVPLVPVLPYRNFKNDFYHPMYVGFVYIRRYVGICVLFKKEIVYVTIQKAKKEKSIHLHVRILASLMHFWMI